VELLCVTHNYDDIKYVKEGWRGGIRGICKEVSNLNGTSYLAGADGRLRVERSTRIGSEVCGLDLSGLG
jgi:hypothetical protein